MIEIAALAVVALVVFVAGIRLGMLVAPRIGRMTEHDEEEPRDDRTG